MRMAWRNFTRNRRATAASALAAFFIAGTRTVRGAHLLLVFGCYLLGGAAVALRLAYVNVLGLTTQKE